METEKWINNGKNRAMSPILDPTTQLLIVLISSVKILASISIVPEKTVTKKKSFGIMDLPTDQIQYIPTFSKCGYN